MLLKKLFQTAFLLSLPFGLGGLALTFVDFLDLRAAWLIWLVGFFGLLIILYRPIKGLSGVVAHLARLEEAPETVPPETDGFFGGEDLTQVLNSASRLIQRYAVAGRRAQKELDVLIDKLPMPLLQVDSRRRVVRQNRAAVKLTGDGALGRDLVLSLRHPELIAAVDKALVSHESANIELTLNSPIQQTYICHVGSLDPNIDQDAVLIVFSDITEVVRGERMRVDFVANASHEIRSPLATLAGCIETLQGPAKDDLEARERFLHLASVEAKRMTTLVGDLLSLSQIEVNQHIAPSDLVDVVSVINSVLSALKASPDAADIEMEVDIPDDLPQVVGDDSELQQVFQNLISNAVRYGGTRVRIGAKLVESMPTPAAPGAGIEVQVRDWGAGIDPIHVPRLTERFYRVDTVRSRELGGTGLGLAIVKHVLNRHRGTLEIESEVGKGSIFSVFLPTVKPD